MPDVTANVLLLLHPDTGVPEAMVVSPIRWPASSELAKLTDDRRFRDHDVVIESTLHARSWWKMRERFQDVVVEALRRTPYLADVPLFSWIGDVGHGCVCFPRELRRMTVP